MRAPRRLITWSCVALLLAAGYAHFPWNSLPEGAIASKVVVTKSTRELSLFDGRELLKTYRVALGTDPKGAKQFEGDGRTPEGLYHVSGRNPHSSYHQALRISYPSADDASRASAVGKSPGGDIMIHGIRNGLGWLGRWHRLRDWTAGCVALTDAEIAELWRAVPDGTPVDLRP